MPKQLKYITNWLRSPFQKDWWLLFMFASITAIPSLIIYWGRDVVFYFGMYIWVFYAVLLAMNISKGIRKWGTPIFVGLFAVYSVASLTCFFIFDATITARFFSTILGTTAGETREFFQTYVGWKECMFAAALPVCICLYYWYCSYRRTMMILPKWGEILLWCFMLFNVVMDIRHPIIVVHQSIFDDESGYFSLDQTIDLKKQFIRPDIKETSKDHPTDVVIIIGESFTKSHSSLYDYEKTTNPMLRHLEEDSLLYTFTDVQSPSTMTFVCFQYILNEKTRKDSIKWYKSPNIMEVFSVAGYHTIWVSNQAETSICDNMSSGQAKFCDRYYFTGNDYNLYDGELLRYKVKDIAPSRQKNLVIYHLLGQHEHYGERYPKQWEHFKASDYASYPESQRAVRAKYDNATLYNDFVVNSLIDLYKDRDALIVYFPDHGVDVYESSPDYYGHAKPGDVKSVAASVQIPFIVYTSTAFRSAHPKAMQYIKSVRNNSLNTEKFIDILLPMCNFQLVMIKKKVPTKFYKISIEKNKEKY